MDRIADSRRQVGTVARAAPEHHGLRWDGAGRRTRCSVDPVSSVGPRLADDQRPKLERVARALRRLLARNSDEVFLIAAHTDAVGSDVDNLSLSDRRAVSVAQVLSEEFGLPTENIVTQGYGEQHLKVGTRGRKRETGASRCKASRRCWHSSQVMNIEAAQSSGGLVKPALELAQDDLGIAVDVRADLHRRGAAVASR